MEKPTNQPTNRGRPTHNLLGAGKYIQLEGTHRVRSHADDWLRHLANVDKSRF